MIKVWVRSENGKTRNSYRVDITDDAIVDDLIDAIFKQTRGVPRVVNYIGNNEEPDKLVDLLHPQGSSKDNPILFTEIIDPPVTAPGAGKKYIVLYYP